MNTSPISESAGLIEPCSDISDRGAVIIVVYNETEHASQCLKSLKKHLPNDVSVVLVDNNSDKNLAKYFKKRFPSIHAIRNKNNDGYAGGNNVGAEYAIKGGAKKVYFLNDDTVVCSDFWEQCERSLYEKGFGIVGSVILHHGRPKKIQEAGKFWDLSRFTSYTRGVNKEYNEEFEQCIECDSVCGAGFMAEADVIEQLDGFEDDFFYLQEESDLCLRAKANDVRVGVQGESCIKHKGNQTVTSVSPMHSYHAVRNHAWLVRRHAVGIRGYILGMTRTCRLMLSYAKRSVENGSMQSLKAVVKGGVHGFAGDVSHV